MAAPTGLECIFCLLLSLIVMPLVDTCGDTIGSLKAVCDEQLYCQHNE